MSTQKEKEKTMTIELIFKIAAVGILVTILGQVLKHSGREEQAFLVSLAGLFIVISWIIPCISELFSDRVNRYRRGDSCDDYKAIQARI